MIKPLFAYHPDETFQKLIKGLLPTFSFDDKENHFYMFLLKDEDPISFIMATKNGPINYLLELIYVKEEYRRLKIGHYSIEFLIAKLRSSGISYLSVYSSEKLLPFYKKSHFRIVEKNDDIYLLVRNLYKGH